MMKKVEITKEIKLAKLGFCKVGSVVEVDDQSAKILVRKGFGKEPATANEVIELIAEVKTLEELDTFSTDTRQKVVAAVNKKRKEIEEETEETE